jgi:hypothetical protein
MMSRPRPSSAYPLCRRHHRLKQKKIDCIVMDRDTANEMIKANTELTQLDVVSSRSSTPSPSRRRR